MDVCVECVADVGDGNRAVQGVVNAVRDRDLRLHAAVINPRMISPVLVHYSSLFFFNICIL